MYVMLTTSFKDIEEIRAGNLLALPNSPTFYAWIKAWGSACTGSECNGLAPFFWNSVRIVVPAVIISTIIGALNGCVLAKWRFRGSDILFGALLFGCFIPFQVILLPMARLLALLGLANTVTGLILVHVIYGLAFTTLFFRNFYVTVPTELVKAAQPTARASLPSSGTSSCRFPYPYSWFRRSGNSPRYGMTSCLAWCIPGQVRNRSPWH